MDEAKRYPAYTLLDLARIPQEALPRFVAELPAILEVVRPFADFLDAMKKSDDADLRMAAEEQELEIIQQCVWIDDDKGDCSINVSIRDADDAEFASGSMKFPLRNAS